MSVRSSRAGRIALAGRDRWKAEDLNDIAAGVTFWAILSLAPAALAFASLLGVVGRLIGEENTNEVRDEIIRFIEGSPGTPGGTLSASLIEILETPSGSIAVIGLLIAVWSLSKGFAALFRGLARIQGHPGARTNLRGRLTAVLFGLGTVGVVLLLLLTSVIGPLAGFELLLPNDGGVLLRFWDWVRLPVLAAATVAWLAVLLSRGPGGRLRWWDALPGAALAAVSWVVLTFGFELYVRLSGGGNPIYGVLGGILVALTWLYLTITAVIVGGLLNALLVEIPSPTKS